MGAWPLATDSWGPDERAALEAVMADGRYTMGPRVARFEAEFAARVGTRRAVMVNSGSSANLLMAAALRWRREDPLRVGDEIVVPAVGWATTYFPFAQQGFRLRLADVDPATINLDPAALAAAIGPRTRAVCLVHALGNPCDLAAISAVIADAERRHGSRIDLLEDTCESLGAEVDGRQAGAVGLMGSYSTFFSHHLQTMEGGLVTTDDDELADTLISLRAHGWTRDLPDGSALAADRSDDPFAESFRFILPGYNVRPLEMSGAVGSVQLARFDGFLAERRANAERFLAAVAPFAGQIAPQREHGRSSWFGFSLRVLPDAPYDRAELRRALAAAGIEHRPVIAGNLLRQPVARLLELAAPETLPGADAIDDHALFLGNGERDLSPQIETLRGVLARLAARSRSHA